MNTNGLPINPAGQALFKYFPVNPSLTTGGFNQVVSLPNTDSMNSFIVKIDHKMNDKMQLSGRYMFSDSLQSAPSSGYTDDRLHLASAPRTFSTPLRLRVCRWSALPGPTIWPTNKIFDTRFNWTRYSQILDVNNKINPREPGT